MKITTRSLHILHIRQLLGLALIGFVLWLAAIGWLLVTPAQAAPGEQRHGNPEKRLACMQTQLNLTPEQNVSVGLGKSSRYGMRCPRNEAYLKYAD